MIPITITSPNKLDHVSVEVSTFEAFFKEKAVYPVGIDTYQRPYVWTVEKVEELINDLIEHVNSRPNEHVPYYMGSILLHQNDEKERLYLIDGQQRMTTLSILYYILHGELIDDKMAMEFHSPISIRNIKNIQLYFSQDDHHHWKEKLVYLFSDIQFTFITTQSEDLAFTFFDTQNDRGVKLQPTDLLKAYHLREINDWMTQKRCAKSWEEIQNYPPVISRQGDFAVALVNKYLWRARRWRGQKEISLEQDNHVLMEFMNHTKKNDSNGEVELFPNFNNMYGAQLELTDDGNYKVRVALEVDQADAKLPFTLRQPINKGLGYFLYTKKYADIIRFLFHHEQRGSEEIERFREFFDHVWKKTSIYLRELYILACVMYYDKFGEKELFRFSLWLDHVLGVIRLEKQNVVKQAPIKFLSESESNLLDIISYAFLRDEVFDFLKRCSERIDIYQKEEVERGKGVRGKYKDRVLSYYGKDGFQNKEIWMDQLMKEFQHAGNEV